VSHFTKREMQVTLTSLSQRRICEDRPHIIAEFLVIVVVFVADIIVNL
jgi:hypothetical protein